MSRNYTMDEDTYLSFLHDDGTDMDLFAFIQVADPTKVKVVERERAEREAKLLNSTIGHVVPLISVVPACAVSELEASVENLFEEGGSMEQGDSTAGGGRDDANLRILDMAVEDTVAGNVTVERPRRQRKKRRAVTDVSGSSHPSKKLNGDYITSSEAATGGKSSSVLKELLASNFLNVEAGVEAMATLPLVTSSLSATSESVAPPLVMIEAVITTNVASIPFVLAPKTGTKVISPVHASMFHDSDSIGIVRPDAAGSSHMPGKELLMGSRDINFETLHELFVLKWNISNNTLLDDHDRKRLESKCESQADLLKAKDTEIENLKAQLLLKEAKAAKAARLRIQVSAAEATEKIHADEIDVLKQRNMALENEKDSLDGKIVELKSSVSAKDLKLKDLNVSVYSLRSQKDGLVDQVHALETTCSNLRDQVSGYERLKEQIEEFQDAHMNIFNDKVANLDADLLDIALHLEEKFYPHLLTTISGQSHYRALKKGMKDGLLANIVHEKEGRSLADVVAYNHAEEADYNSALQRLRKVDFPLLSELSPLVDAPEMSDLQPNADQLMFHVHRFEDQVVLGETSLSFALNVTHSRVERIRENVAARRSALIGVWAPLVDP
ncbi:hypothetical protein Tco_1270181, partial [Tanacetum coccineum]